jgi:hypothetical protein
VKLTLFHSSQDTNPKQGDGDYIDAENIGNVLISYRQVENTLDA